MSLCFIKYDKDNFISVILHDIKFFVTVRDVSEIQKSYV